jgi:DNA replication and repair protein RecF
MPLAELALENIRCIQRAELALAPGINLIHGPNASGKTSILEGIYLLGRGRSFRTRNTERLIRHEAAALQVIGRTAGAASHPLRLAVARNAPLSAEIAGVAVRSLAELAQAFPVQVIEPGIHRLIEEGSPRRRRWLDWAVFHVEPTFIDSWQRYTRVLKQRNAALRAAAPAEVVHAWDSELLRHGNDVTAARVRLLATLVPYWQSTLGGLATVSASLHYKAGWNQDASFEDALAASFARDRAQGVSHVGPHRADVQIRIEGRSAREVASRGQQKLLGTAMVLAQLKLLRDRTDLVSTLLLDDPAAELDPGGLARFVVEVKGLNCQLVLTSLARALEPFGAADRVFHVEQGKVKST